MPRTTALVTPRSTTPYSNPRRRIREAIFGALAAYGVRVTRQMVNEIYASIPAPETVGSYAARRFTAYITRRVEDYVGPVLEPAPSVDDPDLAVSESGMSFVSSNHESNLAVSTGGGIHPPMVLPPLSSNNMSFGANSAATGFAGALGGQPFNQFYNRPGYVKGHIFTTGDKVYTDQDQSFNYYYFHTFCIQDVFRQALANIFLNVLRNKGFDRNSLNDQIDVNNAIMTGDSMLTRINWSTDLTNGSTDIFTNKTNTFIFWAQSILEAIQVDTGSAAFASFKIRNIVWHYDEGTSVPTVGNTQFATVNTENLTVDAYTKVHHNIGNQTLASINTNASDNRNVVDNNPWVGIKYTINSSLIDARAGGSEPVQFPTVYGAQPVTANVLGTFGTYDDNNFIVKNTILKCKETVKFNMDPGQTKTVTAYGKFEGMFNDLANLYLNNRSGTRKLRHSVGEGVLLQFRKRFRSTSTTGQSRIRWDATNYIVTKIGRKYQHYRLSTQSSSTQNPPFNPPTLVTGPPIGQPIPIDPPTELPNSGELPDQPSAQPDIPETINEEEIEPEIL